MTREPPFVIRAATLAWVRAVGYSEQEIIGRSASVLQGEGTCVVTLGALWTALEARALPTATMSLYSSLTGLRSERKTPPKSLYTNRKAQKKRASCMKLFLQWVCLSRYHTSPLLAPAASINLPASCLDITDARFLSLTHSSAEGPPLRCAPRDLQQRSGPLCRRGARLPPKCRRRQAQYPALHIWGTTKRAAATDLAGGSTSRAGCAFR